jgi:HAMP domain-containing protein
MESSEFQAVAIDLPDLLLAAAVLVLGVLVVFAWRRRSD